MSGAVGRGRPAASFGDLDPREPATLEPGLWRRLIARRSTAFSAAVALGVAAIAVFVIGGMVYLSFVRQGIWRSAVEDVLQITEQSSHGFEVFLEKDIHKLDALAQTLESCPSTDVGAIVECCSHFAGTQNVYGAIDLSAGLLYTAGCPEGLRLADDVAERYRSFPERGVREPYIGDYTGLKMIGYYQRIDFADGVDALVYEGAPVSAVAEDFMLSFFDGEGFSYIVNSGGDILVRPVGRRSLTAYTHLVTTLRDAGNSDEAVDEFARNLGVGAKGAMTMRIGGVDSLVAFVPIAGTDGWSVVSVIPESTIMEEGYRVISASTAVFVIVLLVMAVMVAYFVVLVRFERALRRSVGETHYRDELFSVLTDRTSEIFAIMRPDDFGLDYVSPNVGRIMGVAPDRVVDDFSLLDLHLEDGSVNVLDPAALEDGAAVFEGRRTNCETGEALWFRDFVYGAEIDGSRRYILVLSDRTAEHASERVLSEALQVTREANETKSAFLSSMSHDIRTPMNAIVGLVTLLRRDADDPDLVRSHTDKIGAASEHMLGLLNDILDMAKIESGETSLHRGEFSLVGLVDEVEAVVRPQALLKGLEFSVELRGVADDRVVGDKLRLNRVLLNIVGNAVKYTDEGGAVSFTLEELPASNESLVRLRFTVADTGRGIAPEFLERVFDPFAREESSLTNTVQGTGLGLAITKNLVDLMGGTVAVTSEPGRGSTFTVDVELARASRYDPCRFFGHLGVSCALVAGGDDRGRAAVASALAEAGVVSRLVADVGEVPLLVEALAGTADEVDLVVFDGDDLAGDPDRLISRTRAAAPDAAPLVVAATGDRARCAVELGDEADVVIQRPVFLSCLMRAFERLERDRAELARAVPEPECGLAGRHLLAAEDNALSAEILAELLAMEGATVEVVGDGAAAVAAFEAAPAGTFDAVLMDVQMPVMDGYAATRAIRAGSHPDAATVPIVAMTANAFMDDVRDAREAGMDRHLAKPVDISTLSQVLSEICHARAAEKAGGGASRTAWRERAGEAGHGSAP